MTEAYTSKGLNRRALLGGLATAPLAALALPKTASAASSASRPVSVSSLAEFSRRKIGDIEIIALADGYGTLPLGFMPGLDQETAARVARDNYKTHNKDVMNIAINGYIIRTGDRTIAMDTGAPTFMAPTVGAWAQSAQIAGVQLGDIDTLFLSHTHTDHVSGMSGPNGERLLPNAELTLSDAEWGFAHDDTVLANLPDDFKPMARYARAQIAPYGADRNAISDEKGNGNRAGCNRGTVAGAYAGSHGFAYRKWRPITNDLGRFDPCAGLSVRATRLGHCV